MASVVANSRVVLSYRTKCPIFFVAFVTTLFIIQPNEAREASLNEAVQNWAALIKDEIMKASELMRLRTAQDSFQNVKMVFGNGTKILLERSNLVRDLLYRRREAVVKIRMTAESLSDVRLPIGWDYPQPYDAVKKIEVVDPMQTPTFAPPVSSDEIINWTHNISAQFPGWVNTTVSAVHLPSDVYDGSMPPNLTEPIIQHGIWISKKIEKTFLENFHRDNTTSYQYFAHIKGFMRLFPAVQMGNESDYYDARFRPWFSSAATSNKNIVILLDNSGSMKGKNSLVARHIINNILDTLNPDDFVNVVLFGQKTTNATIKCLEDKLVPATFLNVVELKRSLVGLQPNCPSSLEVGLKYAFRLLNETRENRTGAMCNQAIMVVTDGPWMDTSVFGKHNEPFGSANKPVRVFTYQVGEQLREAPGLKWMACQNQGWYLNVTTQKAVRDRVATYIPVMARPWLMHREHLIHWTHAYFHKRDTISVDADWIQHERVTQKRRLETYRKYRKTPEELPFGNEDRPRFLQEKLARKVFDKTALMSETYMVVTVSTPVYNLSVNVTSPYGELLGVAGIDIPIDQIRLLISAHKAGVNNYFFMVNNNGFVIFHPDLRPTFFDILKPTYSSVDMSELEIDFSSTPGEPGAIEKLREQVVNQRTGNLVAMAEQPFDDMSRVETVKRRYFFTGIKDTPYSLVFAVNENIGPRENTFRSGRVDGGRLAEYFRGNWRTHPWWYYCRDVKTSVPIQDDDLLQAMSDWFWDGSVLCDKELIDSLIEDASLTTWFSRQEHRPLPNNRRNQHSNEREGKRDEKRLLEPIVTFIATKSGLTRWADADPSNPQVSFERHFSLLHPRGPEEVWYRRAALHPELTVVTSGPVFPTFTDDVNLEDDWQEINRDDMIITVSKAVLVDGHKKNMPAVVGMQFKQNTLQDAFQNITGSPWCGKKPCVPACGSSELECFLLDADSIIVASSLENSTGSPFGKDYPLIMRGLIDDGFFRVVRIKDNQATCLRPVSSGRPLFLPTEAWMSTSLIFTVMSLSTRFLSTSNAYPKMFSIAAAALISSLAIATPTSDSTDSSYDYGYEQPGKIDLRKFLNKLRIPKSRPQACTRQIDAMQLRLDQELGTRSSHSATRRQASCPDRPYTAAYVPDTNLLLVAVLSNCNISEMTTPISLSSVKFRTRMPEDTRFDLSRVEINYNASCLMAADLDLTRHRNRPHACKTHHPDEELNKTDCGLDHMVPLDLAPPEPPMFHFDYNYQCRIQSAKKKDKVPVEF